MTAVRIPAELAQEVAEHPERFRPDVEPAQRVLVLACSGADHDHIGHTGINFGRPADGDFLKVQVLTDDSPCWASAWVPTGFAYEPAESRPAKGDRILVLDALISQAIGRIGVVERPCRSVVRDLAALVTMPNGDDFGGVGVTHWAILPPATVLEGIDRPGEEVRREPQIGQENVEAICVRVVKQKVWDAVGPVAQHNIRTQVLAILNAAKAEGWTPPGDTVAPEIERLRGRMNHYQGLLRDSALEAERLQNWSNELAARVPEEYEASEGTQEGCIDTWLGDVDKLLAEVEPLVGEAGAFRRISVTSNDGDMACAEATIPVADLEHLQELVARLRGGTS